MSRTIQEVVDALGGKLHGSSALRVHRIASLELAQHGDISFLSQPKYASLLSSTHASCVIVKPEFTHILREWPIVGRALIETEDPYLYFAKLTQWWRLANSAMKQFGIHPSAVVDPTANVDPQAWVGPMCFVGANSVIGAHTRLEARVTVAEACYLGQRCIVHSGAVIGADGFGFAPRSDGSWEKIEQLGRVRIGDDVEIGANTCIDRGALEDTVIENGVKIDNLVQIGHNVHIGAHTALAGNAGVAGSAKIGAYCTIGGGAVVLGHLRIADRVHISASTTVSKSITQSGQYTGMYPIDSNAAWEKNAVTLRQLHQLRDRIRELEKRLDASVNKADSL